MIELRRAKSLNELEHAASLIVWQAHEEGPMSELIWAPEVHYINGKWYIYFAASNHKTIRDESHHHRMFVLENQHIDPMNTDWIEKGQIKRKGNFQFRRNNFLFSRKAILCVGPTRS